MVSDVDRSAIVDECRRVLAANWRTGVRAADGRPYAYTCPAPGHYPWQWYWDSCFVAISRSQFDPAGARAELSSLLDAQREDGFIGHTIFWERPLTGARRLTYNVTEPGAAMTASIQPPLLAWAWSLAVGDPRAEPRIGAHHRWLEEHRDLDGDGLIWIVQPDESGLDASPQFDAAWGWRAHSRPGFVTLVQANRRHRYDARTIRATGGTVVCEVLTNVLYSLSRTALGRPSLTGALIDRCWDERRGLFLPVSDRRGRRPHRGGPATWAALAPLALDDLPEAIGRRLVEEHLLDPDAFWLPAGPPSVSAREPSFRPRESGLVRRYWRGPMWVNAAWLLWRGLVRLGFGLQADDLSARVARAVLTSGLREYYHPDSGAGLGQRDFSWSALVLEMLPAGPAGPGEPTDAGR
ncbi:hypothetical protein [Conexibacter sp. DBS9H8]|uniref:MGH1-like glycoside hydrolase domain-containing protein n=1 Tax=Conexibacter sp. DBS9H8 TaxID=2937801 RepID=UPI00200DD3B5|nr:hypothetical protein [Conexibacter sp. DBS9H8]